MSKFTLILVIGIMHLFFSCNSVSVAIEEKEESKTMTIAKPDRSVMYTGLRSSSYGITPFPSPEKWEIAFKEMQSYFPESTPAGIWIIGNIEGTICSLQFPKPKDANGNFANIKFSPRDKHEKYLEYFDNAGIKVFLQVESGAADMETLIELILSQYGHHKSVIGFGVDLEWYSPNGKKGMNGDTFFEALNDETATKWDNKIKAFNPDYRMFLKHWIWDKTIMPQNTSSNIIFISDSQMFLDYAPDGPNKKIEALDAMVSEFAFDWAENFRQNGNIRSVGYQIGYESDKGIWKDLFDKPYPQNLCNSILKEIPAEQEVSFFWVDFTLNEVFFSK